MSNVSGREDTVTGACCLLRKLRSEVLSVAANLSLKMTTLALAAVPGRSAIILFLCLLLLVRANAIMVR